MHESGPRVAWGARWDNTQASSELGTEGAAMQEARMAQANAGFEVTARNRRAAKLSGKRYHSTESCRCN